MLVASRLSLMRKLKLNKIIIRLPSGEMSELDEDTKEVI